MDQIILYITLLLKILPSLIAAGAEVVPIVTRAYEIWTKGTPPTPADWAMLRAFEARQTAIIQQEIPDDE